MHSVHVQSESMMNLLNEGSASLDQPPSSEGKSTASVASSEGAKAVPSSQQSGSQDPGVQQNENETKPHSKGTAMPCLPMLETADAQKPGAEQETQKARVRDEEEIEEDGAGYAAVKKPARQYDCVDKAAKNGGSSGEDGAGYAYATVGGAVGEGSAKPAQQQAGNGEGGANREGRDNKGKAAGLPYGKVTRHMVPVSKKSGYSEVLTSSPMLPPGRPRAVTEPIDPASHVSDCHNQLGVGKGLRDERAFTESATHLPLPQIPNFDVSEDTYDSIPEELRDSAASATGASNGGARPVSGTGAAAKPTRESVYESVEVENEELKVEGEDEDMYESVPEDVKQMTQSLNSPDTLSPSSPFPPTPRSPAITHTASETLGVTLTPPASPSVKEKEEEVKKKSSKDHPAKETKSDQKKHKHLSKAKSDTGEARGRSLSSFFSRKKAGSVAAGNNAPSSPKPKRSHHEPLPKVPTTGSVSSPTHLLPPSPPPMPAPPPPDDDEEEEYPSDGAYDMIDIINPGGAAMLKNSGNNTAKAKSASLPSSMRAHGASVLHAMDHGPLPDLPEESAGGLVARERITEVMDPEYDTVVLGQIRNDPSYDSVEASHGGEPDAMPKLEPAEPLGPPAPAAAGAEAATQANRYARVSSHAPVDSAVHPPDLTAAAPEHDELGYAVIPAHMKMRKRAQSDATMRKGEESKKPRPKSAEIEDPGYDRIKNSSDAKTETGEAEDTQESDSMPPMEPEYESVTEAMGEKTNEEASADKKETPYASVDMAAKRRSQMLKQQSAAGSQDREPSPNPPPLPQQGDLGDLSEFQQPPVPVQPQAALELIEPSELQPTTSGVVNPYSQIDVLPRDHPYASVKKSEVKDTTEASKAEEKEEEEEEENPYSTVPDNVDGLLPSTSPSDPPYAKIQKGKIMEEKEEDPGYAKARSKHLAGDGSVEPGTDVENVNGTHNLGDDEGDEDTYDRLDHGLGNAATCKANAALTPPGAGGDGEYATVTVDFSTSPELFVTHTDSMQREANGVVRQVEETKINFTEESL